MIQRLSTFAAGLIGGSVVGVVLALIIAPDSGENIRQRIRTTAQQLATESAQVAQARRETLREQFQAQIASPAEDA
ncbi:MAG: YtxH domain-containing protein [Anaerolineales bacterium]